MKNNLPISVQNNVNGNRSEKSVFFTFTSNALCLEDGTIFYGISPKEQQSVTAGEVVFTTGMTGYVESLTDPSYKGQILVFTYPLIGNYGVQLQNVESSRIQVGGVIINHLDESQNSMNADVSLLHWLKAQSIPILAQVDTRSLTKHLRSRGTMHGIVGSRTYTPHMIFTDSDTQLSSVKKYNPKGAKKIILVDCGVKENIVRLLVQRDYQVTRVPAQYDFANELYDGIVLSNGPGDPTDYTKTIASVKNSLSKGKPIFGICLGSQIMALAAGAQTYKLKFGHRGHNQPCIDLQNQSCYMTSQNHGYAINDGSLTSDWEVNFRNLNDNSVEGIRHKTKPFFAVQFHPEASPGPTDTTWLFNRFNELL